LIKDANEQVFLKVVINYAMIIISFSSWPGDLVVIADSDVVFSIPGEI